MIPRRVYVVRRIAVALLALAIVAVVALAVLGLGWLITDAGTACYTATIEGAA